MLPMDSSGICCTLRLTCAVPPPAPSRSNCVNQGNGVGLTALHMAVWGRRSGIMQVLLQHDADISVRSGIQLQPDILLPCVSGSTPLHLAAARGSVEICKLLLKTHVGRGPPSVITHSCQSVPFHHTITCPHQSVPCYPPLEALTL